MKKLEPTSIEQKLKIENAKEQLDHLKKIDTDWKDLDFLVDLIVYKEASGAFKACLIYPGADQKAMGDYAEAYEWCKLSEETQLNYSFKLYSLDEACVVCVNGSHGTHVAGIAAAYHPDAPEKNGTAPGAQVVSIKIGDSRVDTLETTPGVVRALRACIQNNVSVANLSYGEPAGYFNRGAFVDELKATFLKHRMLFITSAGNSGPALTTVGAPACLSDYCLSVGAYAAPASHEPLYSLDQELPEINYTWSSRGPTLDGARGVDICAPGVAITSVPTATLNRNGLMNGTSMAAPNATGCAATVLSSLPDTAEWTPAQLKRVLMNTARNVVNVEPESQGHGLVQVQAAAAALANTDQVHYAINCGSGSRGLYIRHPSTRERKLTYRVEIKPEFHDSVSKATITAYEKHLVVKNKAKWVETPKFVHMSSATKGFNVVVDVAALRANTCTTTNVDLVEDGTNQRLVTIPITVVKGVDLAPGDTVQRTKSLLPGQIIRDYYCVPEHATYATLTMSGTGGKYLVHSMQSVSGHNYTRLSNEWFVNMQETGRPRTFNYQVMPGETLEMVMSKFWSETNHDGEISWSLKFGGVRPLNQKLAISAGVNTIDCISATQERLQPKLEFDRVECPLVPKQLEINALSHDFDKPLNCNEASYKAHITYDLKLAGDQECQIEMPTLRNVLYESMFAESNFFIYNSDNKRVHFGENFKPSLWRKKLTKGDYKIVVELVHRNKETLEAVAKKMVLINSMKLKAPISLDCFTQRDAAIVNGAKSGDIVCPQGRRLRLYVNASLLDEKDDKEAGKLEGRVLTGMMKFYAGDLKNVLSVPAKYPVQPKADLKAEKEVKAKKDDKIEDLMRNKVVEWVKGGEGDAEFFAKQKDAYPDHVPLYHARLAHLLKEAKPSAPIVTDEANQLCVSILASVNMAEVTFTLAKKGPKSPEEKKQADDTKALKDAFICAKATQIRRIVAEGAKDNDQLFAELKELNEIVDVIDEKTNTDILQAMFEVAGHLKLHGTQIKTINKLNEAKSAKANAEHLDGVYRSLAWDFASQQQQKLVVQNYPVKQYRI